MGALAALSVWSLVLDWRVSQQERLERCVEIAERVHASLDPEKNRYPTIEDYFESLKNLQEGIPERAWPGRRVKLRALLDTYGPLLGVFETLPEEPLPSFEALPSVQRVSLTQQETLKKAYAFAGIDPVEANTTLGPAFVKALDRASANEETAQLAYDVATLPLPNDGNSRWKLQALRHASEADFGATDAGLRLHHLAHYHLVKEATQSLPNEQLFPLFDKAYEALAASPSFLSESLIRRLQEMEEPYPNRDPQKASQALARVAAERFRNELIHCAIDARAQAASPDFWFHWEDAHWLHMPATADRPAVLTTDFVAHNRMIENLIDNPIKTPQGVVIEVSLCGRGLLEFGHDILFFKRVHTLAPSDRETTLAQFPLVREQEDSALRVRVALDDPAAFNAAGNARLLRSGAMIAGGLGLSVFGLVFAHRAFQRQVEYGRLQSDFVSSVSHELRTPIASIRLMAENLDSDRVSNGDRVKEYYRFIRAEAARLGALVDNTLDLSRIERGRDAYDFQPVALRRLVDSAVQSVAPLAQSRGAPIRVQWPESEELLGAIWDGSAIQRALINLLDNAIKHAPDGTETLLKVHYSSPDESFTFAVIDRGPGVPEGLRERVFERFFRIESGPIRETPGAGIGLSLVRHIAQAHGGTVVVEETSGGGATFKLTLPILPPGIAPE